ncbi:hypothetical protein RF11_01571 [Thelohanellus kitauei]|uniref:Uncharacterized protein n=1 Tax=Thelohanellus kitauei TaxID=669202 RepID=A0A0C2IR28_THEKT|nr:hypothetical protein RF11_01571 [Thelohanellus kitauei]
MAKAANVVKKPLPEPIKKLPQITQVSKKRASQAIKKKKSSPTTMITKKVKPKNKKKHKKQAKKRKKVEKLPTVDKQTCKDILTLYTNAQLSSEDYEKKMKNCTLDNEDTTKKEPETGKLSQQNNNDEQKDEVKLCNHQATLILNSWRKKTFGFEDHNHDESNYNVPEMIQSFFGQLTNSTNT